jgi:hypothetical protein
MAWTIYPVTVMAVLLSVDAAGAQTAGAAAAPAASVSQAGDLDRTCEQLAGEASALRERLGDAEGPTMFGRLGGLARSGAQLLPGGALVVAGADVASRPERARRDAEAEFIRNRWHYLNGMYLGRRCEPPAVTPHVVVAPRNSTDLPGSAGAEPHQ